MSKRFDLTSFTIERLKRTPQGGVVVPATVARTGVLTYRLPDGSERREYRPPEEVFSPKSMESLRAVPVTHLHPPEEIRPNNWKLYSVGQVDGPARSDDSAGHLNADLAINEMPVVNAVEDGSLREVSAGYDVDTDETPGVTEDGQEYDAVQRNIRFNHIAIGPSQWGRSGPEVSLHLDSGDAILMPVVGEQSPDVGEETEVMKIRMDGKEFEFGSEEHVKHLDSKVVSAEARADAAEKSKAESDSKKEDEDEEKLDFLKKKEDELEAAKKDVDEKAKKMDSQFADRVAARVALERKASEFVTVRADATDRELMIESIQSVKGSDYKCDSRSDDFLAGIFESLEKAGGTGDVFRQDGSSDDGADDKSKRNDSLEEAQRKFEKRQANAWKGE